MYTVNSITCYPQPWYSLSRHFLVINAAFNSNMAHA